MEFRSLDLVYTDNCGIFPKASWNGHRYFITFKMITLVMDNYT